MLQLQNVKKEYQMKAGEVHALNGVSLTFPETGLVFITGKSGCGKTTLLNVIGGLDGIDEGEILIQDKKFSSFSAEEYDSYRNTFIGFIFQEYNLLPEYTVEKNIKIAMELQGRQVDDQAFENLLKDVEIDELKHRKPAELSGGQRQRVAIARALVKQPRIIMADEPTGALDSGTGIQVLDTLKKLSKKTLVIVVSHDREFAEKYADRIVHLEDGKVVQDVTFTDKEIESNIGEQGDKVIVREGADLSETEKDTLAKAIKERRHIEIIQKPCFRGKEPTGEIAHSTEPAVSLRKSKMKLKSTAYLGVKSLTVKPIRLVLTILIAALAFAVFGIFDTIANFRTSSILKNQLKIAPSKSVVATAEYIVDNKSEDKYEVKISQTAVDTLQDQTGGVVKGIYNLHDAGDITQTLDIKELGASNLQKGTRYYTDNVIGFVEFEKGVEVLKDGKFKDFDFRLICGEYPQIKYHDNGNIDYNSQYQIAISAYLADSIIHYLAGKPLSQNSITKQEDLLGEIITIDQQGYAISGIVDCGKIPAKYEPLSQMEWYTKESASLESDFKAYINSGAQKCVFVAKGFLQEYNKENEVENVFYMGNAGWRFSLGERTTKDAMASRLYDVTDFDANNILLFSGEYAEDGKITLADDEVLIHHLNLKNYLRERISVHASNRTEVEKLIEGMEKGTVASNREALNEIFRLLNVESLETLPNGKIHQTARTKEPAKDVKIVGVYFGVDPKENHKPNYYEFMANKNLMEELHVYSEQGDYTKVLFSQKSVRGGNTVIAEHMLSEDGLALTWYNNSALEMIRENEPTIRKAAKLFLYVDIALSVFAIFMLYTYISTSISSKKQSVGILRGLGAGGKNILLMFLIESLIVAVINGIFANVFAVLGCLLVNAYIVEVMNISVHFALFGIRQILIISGISMLTAVASSSLPIVRISKKKPVELIRRL